MFNKIKKVDKVYWILVGAAVGTCLIVFLVGGVFPFGNNTFGCYDFYYQVIDITSNIFNAIKGRSTLFFCFDFANGSSFYGNIFYSCISPFTFILLLGGSGGIRYLFPLMMMLKFITIACVIMFFIRRYFKNISRVNSIILSLLYVFGGYLFLALTQPCWIDFLIYFPLLFIAFDAMKRTGKIRYFSVISALMIATSFSIGVFIILYGLIFFFFYLIFMVEKEKRARLTFKFLLSLAIAISCTLFITIPCFVEVLHSRLSASLISSFEGTNIFRNFSNKVGYLVPSLLLIIPSVLLVIKKWKTKAGKFYFVCLLLVMLPVVFDVINVAINFSQYAGYANRLGALYNFIFLVLAAILINEKKKFSEEGRKLNVAIYILFVILMLVAIVISIIVYKSSGKIYATQNFYSKAWFIIAIFYLVFALCFAFVALFRRLKFSRRALRVLTQILCFVFIVCQTVVFMGASTMQLGNETSYNQYSSIVTADDPYANVAMDLSSGQLALGWSSISGFSSLIDFNSVQTYSKLGYSTGGNIVYSNSNNIFADMLSGMRYRISDGELQAPYLTEISRTDDSILYEYNMYLSHAYFVDELPDLSDIDSSDFVAVQNAIYKSVTQDDEDLITVQECNLEFTAESEMLMNNDVYRDCTASFTYTSGGNELLYAYIWVNLGEMSFDDRTINAGSNFLYFFETKEEKTFSFEVEDSVGIDSCFVYTIDYEKLLEFYSIMSNKTVEVSYTADTITINLGADEIAGKYLVINHPSIYGYEYLVDGESAEVESFAGFIAFDLEGKTAAQILVKYTYPSLRFALIMCAVGVVLLAILLVFAYKFEKLNKKFLKFVNICFYCFVAALALYYFVFPFAVRIVYLII